MVTFLIGLKETIPFFGLNHADLNSAARINSGGSHQQVEISCENSAPKSITEKPLVTPLLSGQCIYAMAEHNRYPEKTQFPK